MTGLSDFPQPSSGVRDPHTGIPWFIMTLYYNDNAIKDASKVNNGLCTSLNDEAPHSCLGPVLMVCKPWRHDFPPAYYRHARDVLYWEGCRDVLTVSK